MREERKRLLREAWALRTWATQILLQGDVATPPPASAAAWQLFLTLEACASPVRAALAHARVQVPDPGASVLNAFAVQETQRALAAKGELAQLDALAARHGWKLVLLKAAVAVAEGVVVQFKDIDLLADRATAEALSAVLGNEGREPFSVAIPDRTAQGRVTASGILLDIQYALKFMPEAAAMVEHAIRKDGSNLYRPSEEDHAWHLLVHVTLQHPERRGRLRDLWLLRGAVQRANGEELDRRARAIADGRLTQTLADVRTGRIDDAWVSAVYARSAAQPMHGEGVRRQLDYRVMGALLPESSTIEIARAERDRWLLNRRMNGRYGSILSLLPRLLVVLYVTWSAARSRQWARQCFGGD